MHSQRPAPRRSDRTRRQFLQAAAATGVAPLLYESLQAGGAGAAQAPAAQGRASDVGSLWPFIERQALASPFPLSFLQDRFTSLEEWRAVAKGKVLELLHYAPEPCDPAAEVVERVDCGDYVRERVWFNTAPDVRVPAFVLVPKGLAGKAPAIVALHDHGGFYLWGKEKIVAIDGEHPVLTDYRARYYGGRSIAEELVRQGYIVAVIDMFYWGERRMLLDDDPADWRERPATLAVERVNAFNARAGQAEQLVGRTIFAAGFTWAGVLCWDDIRTVDYLCSRPDVDATRIGCVGLSVGGLRTVHLTALDERIKAGVAVCWMTSFPSQLRRHIRNTIGHTKLVPGLYRHLDYPDVASLAVPRHLLVISGSKDGLFAREGMDASFETLRRCYAKAGVPDHCRTRLYDSPHQFNEQMQAEAWAWLRAHV
jgi:dienelactone hydrolase